MTPRSRRSRLLRSLVRLGLLPLAAGCAPDSAAPDQEALGTAPAAIVQSASCTGSRLGFTAPALVPGFRFPVGSAHIVAGAATRLRIELRYDRHAWPAPAAAASLLHDSAWWTDPEAALLAPERSSCGDADGLGECLLDDFVARPGRYAFHVIADYADGREECTLGSEFTQALPAVESVQLAPDGLGRLAALDLDGTDVRLVQLYGTHYQRGYAQGYLLAAEIQTVSIALACRSRMVRPI